MRPRETPEALTALIESAKWAINRALEFNERTQELFCTVCRNRGDVLHKEYCCIYLLHAAIDELEAQRAAALPQTSYDFAHEARRIVDALKVEGATMTLICALREAFDAGVAAAHTSSHEH
jgi:hypothetical protein